MICVILNCAYLVCGSKWHCLLWVFSSVFNSPTIKVLACLLPDGVVYCGLCELYAARPNASGSPVLADSIVSHFDTNSTTAPAFDRQIPDVFLPSRTSYRFFKLFRRVGVTIFSMFQTTARLRFFELTVMARRIVECSESCPLLECAN